MTLVLKGRLHGPCAVLYLEVLTIHHYCHLQDESLSVAVTVESPHEHNHQHESTRAEGEKPFCWNSCYIVHGVWSIRPVSMGLLKTCEKGRDCTFAHGQEELALFEEV